jgi:hypothetical protein
MSATRGGYYRTADGRLALVGSVDAGDVASAAAAMPITQAGQAGSRYGFTSTMQRHDARGPEYEGVGVTLLPLTPYGASAPAGGGIGGSWAQRPTTLPPVDNSQVSNGPVSPPAAPCSWWCKLLAFFGL